MACGEATNRTNMARFQPLWYKAPLHHLNHPKKCFNPLSNHASWGLFNMIRPKKWRWWHQKLKVNKVNNVSKTVLTSLKWTHWWNWISKFGLLPQKGVECWMRIDIESDFPQFLLCSSTTISYTLKNIHGAMFFSRLKSKYIQLSPNCAMDHVPKWINISIDCTFWIYGGFLSHMGTPSHHQFSKIFPQRNHRFGGVYPHDELETSNINHDLAIFFTIHQY